MIAVLLTVVAVVPVHAAGLTVTEATISPASTLPALPYWITLAVTNTSDRPVRLPRAYSMEVVPPAGQPFQARYIEETSVRIPDAYLDLEIAPGETRRIDVTTGDDMADGWMLDKRLREPGTYQVRLVFGAVATPVMTVTVEQPAGLDAQAWSALLARTKGSAMLRVPKDDSIGQDLWAQYRESRYGPYFGVAASNEVRRSGGSDRAEKIMDDVMAIDRDGIATKDLRLGRAMRKAADALQEPDLASALRATAAARAELEAIANTAPRELTRQQAKHALERMRPDDELREQFKALKSARE
ncbi:MAG TPA: hypothetical protein VHK90_08115 [Thermoanaerobaculia bacterium]|nr:hypothetical protein [Thermoanaerobaculia bacterium]